MYSNLQLKPREYERTALLLLAGITIVAFLLRMWHLGQWNFQATEIFTWRDSQFPQFRNPRPLGYLLNYFLVRPFLPLDEFGLRLLPAIFGTLAVPAIFLVSRPLIGSRGALLASVFLTVNPLHILYSQLARYWSLVFLLCAVYPYLFYLGIRERRGGLVALGLVTALLAMLAHPVSVLLLGGMAIWLGVTYLPRIDFAASWREAWRRPLVRWGMLAGVIVSVLVLARLFRILNGWISQHHGHVGGQFLSRPPAPPGVKQLLFLANYSESLMLPLVIVGVVGIYLLWRGPDRPLAVFLIALAAFPLVFISLLSLRTPVSTYYVLPTAPVFFIGAGAFFDRLFQVDWKPIPRWVVPVTLATLIVISGVPTILSDYRDGRRYDFRGVAHWLTQRMEPGDPVFSDQPVVMTHYLPGVKIQHLRYDIGPMEQWLERRSDSRATLWVVAPAPSHAFRSSLKKGGLLSWLYGNCQLSYSRGVGRLDLRQNYLHVYRCPPHRAGYVAD
jgi:hypothetical protein